VTNRPCSMGRGFSGTNWRNREVVSLVRFVQSSHGGELLTLIVLVDVELWWIERSTCFAPGGALIGGHFRCATRMKFRAWHFYGFTAAREDGPMWPNLKVVYYVLEAAKRRQR